jgi:hypothetical protein
VPEWLGRLAAGESGVYLSTQVNNLSNVKAGRELGWRPWYATWQDGLRDGLSATPRARARAA